METRNFIVDAVSSGFDMSESVTFTPNEIKIALFDKFIEQGY